MLTLITKNIASFHKVQTLKPPKPTSTTLEIENMWNDIKDAEVAYVQKIDTNRYLNCLRDNNDIEECAICMITYKDEVIIH